MVSTCGGRMADDPFLTGGIPQGDPISPVLWIILCDLVLAHGANKNPEDKGYLLAHAGEVPGRRHHNIYAKVHPRCKHGGSAAHGPSHG